MDRIWRRTRPQRDRSTSEIIISTFLTEIRDRLCECGHWRLVACMFERREPADTTNTLST